MPLFAVNSYAHVAGSLYLFTTIAFLIHVISMTILGSGCGNHCGNWMYWVFLEGFPLLTLYGFGYLTGCYAKRKGLGRFNGVNSKIVVFIVSLQLLALLLTLIKFAVFSIQVTDFFIDFLEIKHSQFAILVTSIIVDFFYSFCVLIFSFVIFNTSYAAPEPYLTAVAIEENVKGKAKAEATHEPQVYVKALAKVQQQDEVIHHENIHTKVISTKTSSMEKKLEMMKTQLTANDTLTVDSTTATLENYNSDNER